MSIVTPSRIFLDTWVLKKLARGEHPDLLRKLRQLLDSLVVCVVVTWDHVADYCSDANRSRAEAEAGFVDTLCPLWMPQGQAIYHREAYSEYCRLTSQQVLPEPFPCPGPAEAMLQWFRDCPSTGEISVVTEFLERASAYDVGATFRREVEYDLNAYDYGWGLSRKQSKDILEGLTANRRWARDSGVTLDAHFRNVLMKHLCNPPLSLPRDQVSKVVTMASLSNMPAWEVFIEVEKSWHKGRAKAKISDVTDRWHLALLPYVDHFVADHHLVSLIRQAKLDLGRTKVYDSFEECAGCLANC